MTDRDKANELVESASAVGGAIAGTALTLLAGPFVGSASGELTARVLRRVGTEIQLRLLGPHQEQRIAAAYKIAIEETKARLEAGDELRTDGFFDEEDEEGGAAGELLEGVMLAAADAWEQRKVPYLGRLFSGTSFDSKVKHRREQLSSATRHSPHISSAGPSPVLGGSTGWSLRGSHPQRWDRSGHPGWPSNTGTGCRTR